MHCTLPWGYSFPAVYKDQPQHDSTEIKINTLRRLCRMEAKQNSNSAPKLEHLTSDK